MRTKTLSFSISLKNANVKLEGKEKKEPTKEKMHHKVVEKVSKSEQEKKQGIK